MDPRLEQAAKSGSTDELYALIDENPYVLENIDAVPFVNTPLHVAAASGNLQFAMEMLNLKPSFARKLNKSGYSPLHLAVDKNHTEFVSTMISLDHDLVRVKGRNGTTPFLSLVSRGEVDLVLECLESSPECIQDASVNGHNALHLAVMNDRFELLQILTGWIQRMAVRLLLECRLVEQNKVNGQGLTCLDILRAGSGRDMGLERDAVKAGCKEAASVRIKPSKAMSHRLKSPITLWTYCSTVLRRHRSNTSDEARGVFLIVCTLILTTTYQTALQPPGGVHQSNDGDAGSVVMKQMYFILLWVTNTGGFSCALFFTFCLLPLGVLFTIWFFWIGISLCLSYALSMAVISPNPILFLSVTFAFFLLFAVYLLWAIFARHWKKPNVRAHPLLTP
ncbi:unnamed protein product [Thlaspi arvense]|uniref:PGG domain-containing protein n=1 Tax=Thlaspi arvense TaxID=13288 RepID=A0AAU9RGC9_THLAR|nr:unnamed protein product [Thlaspi arvense]